MKTLVGTFSKEKVLVGAFFGHWEVQLVAVVVWRVAW